MGWESVPWFVGGGAMHSEYMARRVAHLAVQGAEGIVGLGDLKVTAFGTPGAGVNVAPGLAAILCRTASQSYQHYVGAMLTQDTASIAATGGAVRNDLVVAQVEDSQMPGEAWADPPVGDEDIGPYIFTRVISGVSAGVIASNEAARAYLASLSRSAIPLAGIAIPVSTSAITGAMITDLRKMALPKRERRVFTINPGSVVNLTSGTLVDWFGSWSVFIPAWAVQAVVTVIIGGSRLDRSSPSVNGTANGTIRVILGTAATQEAAYDLETTMSNIVGRNTLAAGDTVAIAIELRGTTQTLRIQGKKVSGNKNIYADGSTFAVVDVEFQEVAN